MLHNILFKTSSGNNYLFNRKTGSFYITHPIIQYLLKLKNENIDIENWFSKQPEKIELNDKIKSSKSEILYYIRKIHFFEENNLLDEFIPDNSVQFQNFANEIPQLIADCNTIAFEVTEKCNLKCSYCGYGENYNWFDERNNKDLSFEKVKNLIDFILKYSKKTVRNFGRKQINLRFYGGEPLLNYTLIKRTVEYVHSLNKKEFLFNFGMTTNGLLLNRFIDFLMKYNFAITISLDGNRNHNSYRLYHNKKPSFNDVIKNIKLIQNKFPDYFKEKVRFNSVLQNKNSVTEIFEYFDKNFDSTPMIAELSPEGVEKNKKADFMKMYNNFHESAGKIEDFTYLEKKKYVRLPRFQDLSKFLSSCAKKEYSSYINLLNNKTLSGHCLKGTCYPFTVKLFMTASGKLLNCENINHEHSFGVVTDKDVKIDFKKIEEKHLGLFNDMRDKCNRCYFSDHCSQCFYYLEKKKGKLSCNWLMGKPEEYEDYLSYRIELFENNPEEYNKILTINE